MRILSQTNDIKGYHGAIGTLTNMYDYRGRRLFVGDVVCLVTFFCYCCMMYGRNKFTPDNTPKERGEE